jgi:uncharacterized protein
MKNRKICIPVIIVVLFMLSRASLLSQSLLWKISYGDAAPSYLYGTIHLTDARVFEWKDSVVKYLQQTTLYAGEIDLNMENMMKAAEMLVFSEKKTLKEHFTPEQYEIISKGFKKLTGYDVALFSRLKPPALISFCYADNTEHSLGTSVDGVLYEKAKELGKRVTGIETVEEQVALLDKIPDSYVLSFFEHPDLQVAEAEKMIQCYVKGDLDSLYVLIQDEESGALLNNELIRDRNYTITGRILPWIKSEPVFVAIGAGHLPGDEGVIALLKKEGFAIEPVIIW